MIISHSKKFIFIHIYKVAGTSIRKVLQPFAASNRKDFTLLTSFKFFLGGRWTFFSSFSSDHLKAKQIKKLISPEVYDSCYKFSFVRNPWDWQVSLFHFMLQDETHPQHKLINKMNSFEEYIEWRVANAVELQKEFLYDEKGNLLVDYVGKFENLQEDFNLICEKLNLQSIELPVTNTSIHRFYKEYYNDYTRDLIAKAFKEDIETFEYEF